MDLNLFPFDKQNCSFKFGSWTYDKAMLDLTTTYGVEQNFPSNLEWNIIGAKGVRSELEYGCCPNQLFPDVTFFIHIQRRSLFYFVNLVLPITMIILLATLTFLLPSDSQERITLSVTLMLANIIYMHYVGESTPESSESIPVITWYVLTCMLMLFVVIAVLCYSTGLHNKKKHDKPMGKFTRRYILDKLSYLIGVRCDQTINTTNSGNDETILDHCADALRKVLKTSRVEDHDAKELESVIKKIEVRPTPSVVEGQREGEMEKEQGDGDENSSGYSTEEEWIIVANTVDRCLFLLFIFTIICTMLFCFKDTQYIT